MEKENTELEEAIADDLEKDNDPYSNVCLSCEG